MGKTLRSKWGLLVLAAALVVGMATIPAVGEHAPESSEVLRLHMGADGNYFQHETAAGDLIGERKDFTPASNCRLNVDNELVKLSGSSSPGYHNQSIGVRGSGGNGVPCSRVDSSESLTVTLKGGLSALAVDLDLELKGETEVKITLSHGEQYTVLSGGGVEGSNSLPLTSGNLAGNCQGGPDSGPDSGPNDNCRVTIDPDDPFTSLTFTLTKGEMSLEGGGDFFPYDPANDTIFYIESWDGVIGCGVPVPGESDTVSAEITRYHHPDDSECDPKRFRLDVEDFNADEEEPAVTFELDGWEEVPAIYRAVLTFEYPLNTPLDAVLRYDPRPPYGDEVGDGTLDGFFLMERCIEDPFSSETELNPDAIPDGHHGCVIDVSQSWDGFTTWDVIFEGDWRFK